MEKYVIILGNISRKRIQNKMKIDVTDLEIGNVSMDML